ncbi:hypothetical protein EMPS_01883 [Entomortierella parvispora]|uniref:Extracellular membrane protein CFEM domain-containing protein n=1 Tax=Entomortierella parvispora TaxID=205924 RepID=A0A9P3H3T4_9FUNG|nr:hypothetical protein EMPS_01883 [Entomortierella parvispora]
MKFTLSVIAAITVLASMVSAQNPAACTLCLQKALGTLPACVGTLPTAAGEAVTPAYAACLCSSLTGNWIDSCNGDSDCGSSIALFKANYPANIEAAGLNCNGTPSFNPPA